MNTVLSLLIPALIMVESGGNGQAIGDNGRAVGCLQIHAECVQDVNRVKGTAYTVADRADRQKSEEMCRAYLMHYGNAYRRRTGKEPTAEVLARIWNGGPRGDKNPKTARYWAKVKTEQTRQATARKIASHTPKKRKP